MSLGSWLVAQWLLRWADLGKSISLLLSLLLFTFFVGEWKWWGLNDWSLWLDWVNLRVGLVAEWLMGRTSVKRKQVSGVLVVVVLGGSDAEQQGYSK